MDSADELQVIGRFLAVAARNELVFDFLALGEVVEAGALHRRDVHEGIGSAAVRLDEPVALCVVEPLYGSCIQGLSLT